MIGGKRALSVVELEQVELLGPLYVAAVQQLAPGNGARLLKIEGRHSSTNLAPSSPPKQWGQASLTGQSMPESHPLVSERAGMSPHRSELGCIAPPDTTYTAMHRTGTLIAKQPAGLKSLCPVIRIPEYDDNHTPVPPPRLPR